VYKDTKFFPPCIAVSPFRYKSINISYFMAFPLPSCILYWTLVFIYVLTLALPALQEYKAYIGCQKPEGEELLKRPRRKRGNNIEIDPKEAGCGLD
jgi:hypothetical protein